MIALILASLGLGLRHGVDWDHIAAIADITGAEYDRRRSAWLATVYALGHGAAVMTLGSLAILAGDRLPDWIDPVMERVVGATLLILAVLLIRGLWRKQAHVSRGVLLFNGLRAMRARVRRTERVEIEHDHAHNHGYPGEDRTTLATQHVHAVDVSRFTVGGALAVGLLHGVGAETGTQALVLVSASRVTSTAAGVAILGAFVLGIVITTSVLALGSAYGWRVISREGMAYRAITIFTAVTSGLLGVLYLAGLGRLLPAILA